MGTQATKINVSRPGATRPKAGFGALAPGSGWGDSSSEFFSGIKGPPPPIKKATVGAVDPGKFGMPSREGLDQLQGQTLGAYHEFRNPTESGAFKNLMSLTAERTSRLAQEEGRQANSNAQRRGYGGGAASLTAAQAVRERMGAMAESGFAGAHAIRDQAAGVYGSAVAAYGGALQTHNAAIAQRNQAIFEATTQAQQLQANLDQQFNDSLIDAAKYTQMSSSLEAAHKRALLDAELRREELEENARQFNVTSNERTRQFDIEAKEKESQFDDLLPLRHAEAETQRISTVGAGRYNQPGFENMQYGGPASMDPNEGKREPFGTSGFQSLGAGGSFGSRPRRSSFA